MMYVLLFDDVVVVDVVWEVCDIVDVTVSGVVD